MFSVSYKRLMALSGDGEITAEEEQEMKEIDILLERNVKALEDAIMAVQKEFAKKNNMKLEEKTSYPKFN